MSSNPDHDAVQRAASTSPPELLPIETLRERYRNAAGRFIDVDGAELHVAIEGQGPPLVLLNPSFMGLEAWSAAMPRLAAVWRVIRLDFPYSGLSGADRGATDGAPVDLIVRNVSLVLGVADRLGIGQFALAGASTGASTAFHLAAVARDRVTRLALINSAGLPRTAQTDPNRDRPDRRAWSRMPVKPRDFWVYSLGQNMPSLPGPPDWLVDYVFDINRRAQRMPAGQYGFATGDPQSVLARIEAPTLIQWGLANPTVMHLEADVIQHWMTGAPTTIRKYPALGHYPFIEEPQPLLADLEAFLRGDLDAQLRRTTMLPIGARVEPPAAAGLPQNS
jgi:pimeloyl-ACP methyl ester carboxylesterase